MTELSASAGSEGYAACDDEAKDMQLATTRVVFSHVVSGVALVAVAAEGLAVYEVGIRLGLSLIHI